MKENEHAKLARGHIERARRLMASLVSGKGSTGRDLTEPGKRGLTMRLVEQSALARTEAVHADDPELIDEAGQLANEVASFEARSIYPPEGGRRSNPEPASLAGKLKF